jgi:hypothetical protein
MALQLNTGSVSQFTDLVKRMFNDSIKSFPSVFQDSGLVKFEVRDMNDGIYTRVTQAPVTTRFASFVPEGQNARAAAFQYGYEKDLQVRRYGLDIGITRLMRIGNKNPEIISSVVNLSRSINEGLELDLTHFLTFGTSTSYVDRDGNTRDISTADGLALFSASHTLSGSALTYSNIVSGNPAFSKGSLETMERLIMEQTYDNLGQKLAMKFDLIWCGDDSVTNNRIDEELGATADTTSSNAGTINVNNRKYRKVKLPYLATLATGAVDTTKRRYWGIACSEYTSLNCRMLEKPYLKTPQDGNNGEEFSSENWQYASRGSYGLAVVDAMWIKGSFPVS